MRIAKYLLITLVVVIIDQASKLLVHKYMYLHEEVDVIGHWFRLHYLLNAGMAFGIELKNEFGKLILTLFRIGAMLGIGWYLVRVIRRSAHPGFLFSMALILGGAIGNVIDSTFYGVFLHNSPVGAPTPWFHGKVIDMLFFPIFEFTWPAWVPFKGGEEFLFFSPVFNIADSSIFVGVVIILIFQRHFFHADLSLETTLADVPQETHAKRADDDFLSGSSNSIFTIDGTSPSSGDGIPGDSIDQASNTENSNPN